MVRWMKMCGRWSRKTEMRYKMELGEIGGEDEEDEDRMDG